MPNLNDKFQQNLVAYDRKGCKKGDNCQFCHPTLCKFSVAKRACFNPGCTFVHLKGTNRSRQKDSQHNESRDRARPEIAKRV